MSVDILCQEVNLGAVVDSVGLVELDKNTHLSSNAFYARDTVNM